MSALLILGYFLGLASVLVFGFALKEAVFGDQRQQNASFKRKLGAFGAFPRVQSEDLGGAASEGNRRSLAEAIVPPSLRPPLDLLLSRSASTSSVGDLVKVIAGFAITSAAFCALVTGSIAGAIIIGALAGALPVARLHLKAERRRRLFESQLPDALEFLARALRSGHGLTMAFQNVAEEMPAPICEEFRLVCDELNFGNAFHDALAKMPDRIASPDLSFFVTGVLIQRETGGNLSDLLRTLANTVRERMKLHGKVRALAAEGKFSGILLGVMPFALAGILTLLNPTYMGALWFTPVGHKWLVIGGVMLSLGFAWMLKIAQIKV